MPGLPVAAGVYFTAGRTGSQGRRCIVKNAKNTWQIFHDALHLQLRAVNQRAAMGAVPLKSIEYAGRPGALEHAAQAAPFDDQQMGVDLGAPRSSSMSNTQWG